MSWDKGLNVDEVDVSNIDFEEVRPDKSALEKLSDSGKGIGENLKKVFTPPAPVPDPRPLVPQTTMKPTPELPVPDLNINIEWKNLLKWPEMTATPTPQISFNVSPLMQGCILWGILILSVFGIFYCIAKLKEPGFRWLPTLGIMLSIFFALTSAGLLITMQSKYDDLKRYKLYARKKAYDEGWGEKYDKEQKQKEERKKAYDQGWGEKYDENSERKKRN